MYSFFHALGFNIIISSQDSASTSKDSDGNTPQLTSGLPSSSKNVANRAKNQRMTLKYIRDPPELNKVLPSLADIKAITKPSKDANLPVDILLLSVTTILLTAVYLGNGNCSSKLVYDSFFLE